jgi:superfamily II DNA or RNA helicase
VIPTRDYQETALQNIEDATARGLQRQLVAHPTGAGKTVTFAHLIARRPGRSVVLVHRDELGEQTADKMFMIAPHLSVGMVKAAQNECAADVVIASVQTVCQPRRLAQLGAFSTVVVDEAHHAVAPTWRRVLEGLGSFDSGGPLTVGFTATPQRDKGGIGEIWQDVVDFRTIREMVFGGYLVPPVAQVVETKADFSKVKKVSGDLSASGLGDALESSGAIADIAEAYVTHAAARKGVAFLPTVATAKELQHELWLRGIDAEAVWGDMPLDERRAVLRRLHTGETQVVTNCGVLTEGFDEPSIGCIAIARPTNSHSLYIQMVGRGLRPYPGKTDCLILDIVGATVRHDMVSVVDLDSDPTAGKGRKGVKAGAPAKNPCALCGRQLSPALLKNNKTRHPNCAALGTSATAGLLIQSKMCWLPIEDSFVLATGKTIALMAPVPESDLWRLVDYDSSGRLTVLHGALPAEWAQGIGEDRARAFHKLSEKQAGWRNLRPTGAQLSRLVREGLPSSRTGQVRTRGQAADLLTRLAGRRALRKLVPCDAHR